MDENLALRQLHPMYAAWMREDEPSHESLANHEADLADDAWHERGQYE